MYLPRSSHVCGLDMQPLPDLPIRRLFQQTLDGRINSIRLNCFRGKGLDRLVKRMQHMHGLREVSLDACYCTSPNISSLLKLLPNQITTLDIHAHHVNVKGLQSLPCLTSLSLAMVTNKRISGIDYLSGLSRLRCNSPVGSLAHLAPTLKCFSIRDYNDVQGIHNLTSLEVLEFRESVPEEFFKDLEHVPLKHLSIRHRGASGSFDFTRDPDAWQASPTTLTRLTLGDYGDAFTLFSYILPVYITHLQLSLGRFYDVCFEAMSTALPALKSLDLMVRWRDGNPSTAYSGFEHISKLTNLQSLGIVLIRTYSYYPARFYDDQIAMPWLPFIAKAIKRGVKLKFVEDLSEVEAMWSQFYDLSSVETTWDELAY